jgi:hypothetical protein
MYVAQILISTAFVHSFSVSVISKASALFLHTINASGKVNDISERKGFYSQQ